MIGEKIIFGLCLSLLLVGCINNNISDEIERFCEERNPSPNDYHYVEATLKDYFYDATQVKCEYFNNAFSLKYEIVEIYNISCPYDFLCKKYNEWGDCTKGYYKYSCDEINYRKME